MSVEYKTDSDSDVPAIDREKPYYIQGIGHDILEKSVHDDSDEDLIGKEEPSKNPICQNSLIKILSSLNIEGLMFMFMFSYMMRNVITTNMIMDKACRFRLNFSEDICANLSNYTEEKAEVEKIANDYSLYLNLLHMGPAALIMIFMAPWSDKYGRKLPLMIAILGSLLDDVGSVLNAYFFDAKLEYMLLSSVPTGLSGGFIGFLTIAFSLVSEITTKETRTRKYAIVELFFGLGMTCGSLAGGQIYKYVNSYVAVYCASAAGHMICGMWVLFLISETKGLISTETWKQKFCDAFSFKRMIEGFKVCMKVRENNGRTQIWLIFASMSVVVVTYESFSSIGYTYVHHRYNWDPAMFSYVTSLSSAIAIVVMVIFIPLLTKVFKVRDAALGIIGTVSSIGKNVSIGLAYKPWIYYMGNVIGSLSFIAMFATRAMLSKLVPQEDLGKVFGFLSTCEALVPLGGSIAMTKIFNATLLVFPGLCYIIGSSMLVIPLGVYIWISRLKTKENQILKSQGDDFPSLPGKTP